MKNKNIVVIGGGTGTFTVLSGLKAYPVNLTAVVSMADDGGSTGLLRDEYGVLPPGDVRRALIALSGSSDILRNLFTYRFPSGSLKGHSFGNLFLTALEKTTGSFSEALTEASRILNIQGEVVPVTLDNVRLIAQLSDGKVVKGEKNIDVPKSFKRASIAGVWLEPKGKINPRVKEILNRADLIVIGPGDLYTSIVPNLLVRDVAQAIRKSKARKIYVGSLMTKFGETHGFGPQDFIKAIEKYLGRGVLDIVIFNSRRPKPRLLKKYSKERAEFVDVKNLKLSKGPKILKIDVLDGDKFIRHNADKLAKVILSL